MRNIAGFSGKLILLLLFVFFSIESNAQVDKSIRKLIKTKFEEANYYYQFDNYHLALPVFNDIIKLDSSNIEATYKAGVCIFNIRRNRQESLNYFQKAASQYKESLFYLGILYHELEKFDKAIECYTNYKNNTDTKLHSNEEIDFYLNKCTTAKEMINSKINVNIQNLGDKINSPYPDYSSIIQSDESQMFFTSRREGSTGDKKDPYGEYFEDIYMSKNIDGKWSDPVNLGSPINTDSHDACVTITADGQELYIYRTNSDLLGGDIYISKKNGETWSTPEKIQADINFKNSWTPSASISPDNQYIYFSSNRLGGYGQKDIYRVTILPNGKWSLAENLGSAINTPYEEDAPFIHPDGKTLYFSSKGHQGMGGYDIFKTTLNDDGTWSAPENVGYPLNSVLDDIYFFVSTDGKRGYFSSNRPGGVGLSDIYFAELLDNPSNYIILKGTVTTNEPTFLTLKATISIIDAQSGELMGVYRTTKESGKYIMVLLPKHKYKMMVEADGYYSYSDEIDMTKKLRMEDVFKNVSMKIIPEKNEQPQDETPSNQ